VAEASRVSEVLPTLGGPDGEGSMSINRTRGSLYRLARLLGDVQAVKKGRVGKRIGRRVVGRYTGRGIGRLFR